MSNERTLASVYVQELYPYTKDEMKKLVGSRNEEQFQLNIDALKKLGVLSVRGQKETVDRTEIADFIDRHNIKSNDYSDGKVYSFSFVGIIVVEGRVYKCYPKYMNHYQDTLPTDAKDELKKVLYSIEKYNTTEDKHNTWIKEFHQLDEERNFNLLSLILFLIGDYYEYGLYKEYHKINEVNGDGEIQWERTIDEYLPVFTNNRPIYPELVTSRVVTEEDNYFERLHSWIITEAIRYMKQAELLDIFENIIDESLTEEELSDFGETDYILKRIEAEITQQFNSRKQNVLLAMHAFISKPETSNSEANTLVYGSHSFYHVWEVICKSVFNDALDKKLCDIELPTRLDNSKYKKNKLLKDIVCKPTWFSPENSNVVVAESKETMELDTVSIFKYKNQWCFAILDAKYYLTNIGKTSISHTPGIVDIEKEYFYQLAYHEFMDIHRFNTVTNCFVMPLSNNDICQDVGLYAGCVSLPIFDSINFSLDSKDSRNKMCRISIVKLKPSVMYEWYLNGVSRNSIKYKRILDLIMTNSVSINN